MNSEIDVTRIEDMVARRNEARAIRAFAEADRMREELEELGIVVEDKGDRTEWRRASS